MSKRTYQQRKPNDVPVRLTSTEIFNMDPAITEDTLVHYLPVPQYHIERLIREVVTIPLWGILFDEHKVESQYPNDNEYLYAQISYVANTWINQRMADISPRTPSVNVMDECMHTIKSIQKNHKIATPFYWMLVEYIKFLRVWNEHCTR